MSNSSTTSSAIIANSISSLAHTATQTSTFTPFGTPHHGPKQSIGCAGLVPIDLTVAVFKVVVIIFTTIALGGRAALIPGYRLTETDEMEVGEDESLLLEKLGL